MPGPVQPASSTIGALLRQIVEDKTKAPHTQVPTTQPTAPARELVEAPLEEPLAAESPGSARRINISPESSAPVGAGAAPAVPVTPGTSKVGPIGGPGIDAQELQAPSPAQLRPGEVDTSGLSPQERAEYAVGLDVGRELPRNQTIEGWKNQFVSKYGPKNVERTTGKPQYDQEQYKQIINAVSKIPEGYAVDFDKIATPQRIHPNLNEYLAGGGQSAAQWYARTGQQSTLDAINKDVNTHLNPLTGAVSFVGGPRSGTAKLNPVTGVPYFEPEPWHPPNTATLQDYLNQGKTAEQWFAETGRQSELDQLTRGATVPLSQGSLQPYLPQPEPQGRIAGINTSNQTALDNAIVLGRLSQNLAPIPTAPPEEFMGPPGPQQLGLSANELNAAAISVDPNRERINAINEQEALLLQVLAKPPEQRTEEEQEILLKNRARSLGDRLAQQSTPQGQPTPTPRSFIPLPTPVR